ncbi:hypothetical protein EJ08DRAFT_597893 [Tothia fuscella]|uniref:Mannosyltransferase n=1 Tax=Tothia fuscella TaxID=1048955 RepID=A0A9P4TTC3_9PEZI|nr:hypothetical protein EJ08DRAFT_597893 [Tothia fuscella]
MVPESAFTLLLLIVILLYLRLAPYTKVEESFNIQATHDILSYGVTFNDSKNFLTTHYDHIDFPGSVPRTFVGAVFLSAITTLSGFIAALPTGAALQFLVRAILGLTNAFALLSFRNALQRGFGKTTANWFIVLQVSQFHVMYYASRTLPNMFAFAITTFALRSYILAITVPLISSRFHWKTLALVTYAGVVFRSELAVLVLTLSAYILFTVGRYSLTKTIIPAGITGLVLGLLTTVPIDSFFWQQYPLWPEWSSFYYNTILGNSSNWGVSPWHFYFSNALPRLLLNPLSYGLLIPLALFTPSTRQRSAAIVLPLLSFVALYSALSHKEWRFILYVIPGLTSVSAIGATWIWNRRAKSVLYRFLSALLLISVFFSFLASFIQLSVSRLNYPGGQAIINLLHTTQNETCTINIYVDNLASQTGVTRFLENRHSTDPKYVFDKTEDISTLHTPEFWDKFDYVLTQHPETTIGKFEVIDTIYGWAGLRVVRPGEEPMKEEMLQALALTGDRFGNWMMVYEGFERNMRDHVTRGWWISFRIEPRLNILRRQNTGPQEGVDEEEGDWVFGEEDFDGEFEKGYDGSIWVRGE